jgi:hypothetical protein
MNFVYISPNFPDYSWNFCDRLKKQGVNVLGIGDAPYDELDNNLKNALTEYYKVDNLENYDELVRACGFFTHKYGHIDRLDSNNEHWLEVDARLRTDFNIEGLRYPDVLQIRRKSAMKKYFKKAGVPSARFSLVSTLATAKKFIAKVGYPVIVKPDTGVGAAETYALHNNDELVAFFENLPACQYIMEEFINGQICTFDGITNSENEILFCTSHHFPETVMDTVNNDTHMGYYSMRDIGKEFEEAGRKVVAAFNTNSRFFHFEFFRMLEDKEGIGKKGDIIALEVNMRPPGGYMVDMINYANNVDIYNVWADMIVQDKLNIDIERKYHAGYASRKDHYTYKHSHEDILAKFGDRIVHHKPIEKVFQRAMGHYAYLFRSPNLKEIKEIIAYIHA